MTKDEFKDEYLKNAFFWVNENNHLKIQEIMQVFGIRSPIGEGFIKWHKGFKSLCTFPPDDFHEHEFYQKVDIWIPNARYGKPKNVENFFKDFKQLKN